MENNLTIIKEQEVLGKDFKVYGTLEEPLFLAKDVAEWIDYAKRSDGTYQVGQMLKSIDDDEKLTLKLLTSGQNREMWFLTENGLYEVLMQSTKPIAKEFKKEVKKILHEIRLTGKYEVKTQIVRTMSSDEVRLHEEENRLAKAKFIEAIGEKSPVQTYRNICDALAVNIAANGNYLPLPKPEHKTYKATELAKEFGVTPQLFGSLANKNNVKTSDNGEIIWDLGKNGKQIENFVYYESGREVMKNLCTNYKTTKGVANA